MEQSEKRTTPDIPNSQQHHMLSNEQDIQNLKLLFMITKLTIFTAIFYVF